MSAKELKLTPRQTEVWRRLASSETTKAIAFDLHISNKTVEYHRGKLMTKLHIFDIAGLTRAAIRRKVITL